jgi:flagellar motor switch protein FliN/FliY
MTEPLTTSRDADGSHFSSLLAQVSVDLSVRVGTGRLSLAEIGRLAEGSVVVLREGQHQPLELFAGDHLIARGELEAAENEEGYIFRVTELTAEL